MAKHLQVTMPDGSKWAVPVDVIAMNRAAYYAKNDGLTIEDSLNNDTNPLFASDDFEIEDWAANNMNWSDVEHLAVCTGNGVVDFDDGWANGDKSVIDI
jgi:hypothetical protein